MDRIKAEYGTVKYKGWELDFYTDHEAAYLHDAVYLTMVLQTLRAPQEILKSSLRIPNSLEERARLADICAKYKSLFTEASK